jgi:hypothetical protein
MRYLKSIHIGIEPSDTLRLSVLWPHKVLFLVISAILKWYACSHLRVLYSCTDTKKVISARGEKGSLSGSLVHEPIFFQPCVTPLAGEIQNKDGETPLSVGVVAGNEVAVKLLLEFRATVNL